MTLTRYFHYIPTKEEEEKGEGSVTFPLQAFRVEIVETRDTPLHLMNLLDPWEIQKVLLGVDVGTLGGLFLSQEQVYTHIFNYWNNINRELVWDLVERGKQIMIQIKDLDTNTDHTLYFKKSTIDGYFVISTFWNRDFVYRRGLKEGDLIGMYWDSLSNSFCFSLLKRAAAAGGAE